METANSDFKSKVKSFFSKTSKKIKLEKIAKKDDYEPQLTNNGLLSEGIEKAKDEKLESITDDKQNVVATPVPAEKNPQIEKMQEGFNNLVGQLQSINTNLDQQIHHQQQLIERLDKLPQLFESFAPSIMNQQQLTEQMIEELRSASIKNTQFIESIERIPNETAKQTDALENIDHQLAASAASDAQMANSFKNFTQSIENLDQTAAAQTDSIMQMSKTFAASDRYLKYIITRDKKRMFWLFTVTLTICIMVITVLIGIVIYLNR
jgi:chromosome segregation ATPase